MTATPRSPKKGRGRTRTGPPAVRRSAGFAIPAYSAEKQKLNPFGCRLGTEAVKGQSSATGFYIGIGMHIITRAILLASSLWFSAANSSEIDSRTKVLLACSGTGDFVSEKPVPPEQLEEWNKHAASGHQPNTGKTLALDQLHDVMYVEISNKVAHVRLPKDLRVLLGDKTDVWSRVNHSVFRGGKIAGALQVPELYTPDISIDLNTGKFLVISPNVQYSGRCTIEK